MNLRSTENKVSFYFLNKRTNSTDNCGSKSRQTSQNQQTVLLLFAGHHRHVRAERPQYELLTPDKRHRGVSLRLGQARFPWHSSASLRCSKAATLLWPDTEQTSSDGDSDSKEPAATAHTVAGFKCTLKGIYHLFITLPLRSVNPFLWQTVTSSWRTLHLKNSVE